MEVSTMESVKSDLVVDLNHDYERRARNNSRFVPQAWIIFIDFLLLNTSFFLCNFFKHDTLALSPAYTQLLFFFYPCWFLTSMVGRKFKASSYPTFGSGIYVFLKSTLYLTYAITFMVVVFGLAKYSRLMIFSTCGLLLFMESSVWSFYKKRFHQRQADTPNVKNLIRFFKVEMDFSYLLVGMDFVCVVASFLLINQIKRGHLYLLPEYHKLFLIFIGVWFIASFSTSKFSVKKVPNFYFFIWQWLKAGFLILAMMSVLVFGLRLFQFSRFQAFGSVCMLMVLEFLMTGVYFWLLHGKETDRDIESVDKVKAILKQDAFPLNVDIDAIRNALMAPARNKLKKRLNHTHEKLFEFIDEHIDIKEMLSMETAVEECCTLYNVTADRPLTRLFINLHKSNDIRRLNEFFLNIHQRLLPGGYFVGYAHTITTHNKWIYANYPRYIAQIVFLLDFCFHRIMPKLPVLQQLYFIMTKGKNRVISKAEFMGRLCFCGFEIVADQEIDNRLYVIAKKVKTSSLDTSPTYGPLVQLKRTGYRGITVPIYKFRTMHPYSEYLQQYMYDHNGLQKGGKIENDFRLTTWGKFMRKLWLDELPMLYNWLKGDMQLVGVRPLSFQYLSLYDADLQELRKLVKPGLVPPFYADLPETFEDICDSERRYIRSFLKNPVRTQIYYFWKSFVNIAIKGARSK